MEYTQSEVLQYVAENDVKFIKLFFTDIFGNLKSVSIQPPLLRRAFAEGISFDASAVPGFLNAARSDLFLVPDPATLTVLPWRPQHGRVARMYCGIRTPGGEPFAGDTRHILHTVTERAAAAGYDVKVGTECEFYLFKLDEHGRVTTEPHDRAGYCDLAPLDKGENVRRDIILNLEQMGIEPETSHHETGPGQNEIDFKYASAMQAADNLATFKNTVRTIAAQDGLFASFAPKPSALPLAQNLPEEMAGSGLHVNLSLHKNGENIIGKDNPEEKAFVAGILRRVQEMTAFLNPLPNSYARLGKCEAPRYVSWSSQNRSQLIRVPAATGEAMRVELRSPDPACNQYTALALIIAAGLEGIQDGLEPLPPCDLDLYAATAEQTAGLGQLPQDLAAAVGCARKSDFVRSVLPSPMREAYLDAKASCTDPGFGAL